MRIGFVGLGTMGGPMARRLAAQGHQVTGYDVAATRAAQAREAGVALATSPAGAAEHAEAVLSSLPDPAALRRAYLDADGVLSTVKAGAALLDLSTVDPDTWREVAAAARARGADCLDAPVSGGPAEAGTGKLVFLVGGDVAVVERCRALLMTLGTEIHHVGPLGSGQIVKIVNNVMSMGNVAVAAEAMVLGVKAGMDPQRLFTSCPRAGGARTISSSVSPMSSRETSRRTSASGSRARTSRSRSPWPPGSRCPCWWPPRCARSTRPRMPRVSASSTWRG